MISGIVNANLEVTVPLLVRDANDQPQVITAVIDTGYNGALTLPLALVTAWGLAQGASREVTLGDATRRVCDYYTAHLVWDGQTKKVRVLCVEGDPLIGTALLAGYNMNADFIVDGLVLIGLVKGTL